GLLPVRLDCSRSDCFRLLFLHSGRHLHVRALFALRYLLRIMRLTSHSINLLYHRTGSRWRLLPEELAARTCSGFDRSTRVQLSRWLVLTGHLLILLRSGHPTAASLGSSLVES